MQRLIVGADTLLTTPEHLFYSSGGWVAASALRVGMPVQASGGVARVVANQVFDSVATVYNFAVAYAHTYHVGRQEKLMAQLCCEGDKKYIGAEFVLRHAAGRLAEVERFEEKTSDGGRVIDIVIKGKGSQKIRQECKSWLSFSPRYYSRTIKEFVTDLRDVDRLEDMQWVFDAKGLFTRNARGRAYLKEQFIRMLQTQEGKDALKELSATKVKSLLDDDAINDSNKVNKLIEFLSEEENFFKIFK